MKILLTRSVGIRGQGYSVGEMLDVEIDDAKALVSMGKAVFPSISEPATVPGPKVITRSHKKQEEAAAAKLAAEEAAAAAAIPADESGAGEQTDESVVADATGASDPVAGETGETE